MQLYAMYVKHKLNLNIYIYLFLNTIKKLILYHKMICELCINHFSTIRERNLDLKKLLL